MSVFFVSWSPMLLSGENVQQLLQDCAILFGNDADFSLQFLEYLQPGGLKSAYRLRAMETHPDRLRIIEKSRRPLQVNRFYEVQAAFERLRQFLDLRDSEGESRVICAQEEGQEVFVDDRQGACGRDADDFSYAVRVRPFSLPGGKSNCFSPDRSERLYSGSVPSRPLLFGNFLYYLGLTNWRTISKVLIVQRLGRPRLGELALDGGLLNPKQVDLILAGRKRCAGRRFGEMAVDLGMATPDQMRTLMIKQRLLQKRFGTILKENSLIDSAELHELLRHFRLHNQRS